MITGFTNPVHSSNAVPTFDSHRLNRNKHMRKPPKNIWREISLVVSSIAVLLVAPQFSTARKKGGGGASAPTYDLVVLAPPNVNVTWSTARDVNTLGNVVGHYEDDSGSYFAYHFDRASNSFETLIGGTDASGLNSHGEIVGGNRDFGVAIYWEQRTGVPEILEGLTELGTAVATDINDSGIAVGHSFDAMVSSAITWQITPQGTSTALELLPLPGDTHALARGVSNFDSSGIAYVVGYSGDDRLGYEAGRAVIWGLWVDEFGVIQFTPAIDLGALDGGISTGNGVNSKGDTCGDSEHQLPFFKSVGATMQSLDMPRKAASGSAYGLNDAGAGVGRVLFQVRNGSADERAYLWSAGRATDLNTKVALGESEVLISATAISNRGHIVGMGFLPSSSEGMVGFLLIPR